MIDPEAIQSIDSWFRVHKRTPCRDPAALSTLRDILGLFGDCYSSLAEYIEDGHFAHVPSSGDFNVSVLDGDLITSERREALEDGARPTAAELMLFKKHYGNWIFAQDSGWFHYYVWRVPALGRFYYLLSLHGDGGILDDCYGPYKSVRDLWKSNSGLRE